MAGWGAGTAFADSLNPTINQGFDTTAGYNTNMRIMVLGQSVDDVTNVSEQLTAQSINPTNGPQYYTYDIGNTTEPLYIQAQLAGVKVWVQNLDVWPTQVVVNTNYGYDSQVLPWGQEYTFQFYGPLATEPITWRINIYPVSESFSVMYRIDSTWVPNLPLKEENQ